MELLAGPTFSIQVDEDNNTNHDNRIFLKDDDPISGNTHLIASPIHPSNGFCSDSSSSIGAPDNSGDDDEEEEEEEVGSGSSSKGPLLGLLDSLEASLPIKRGLSNHFAGKSKSFTNLSEVTSSESATVKDLAKPENPFNKRRRMLLTNRLAFRSSSSSSSFYTCSNPKSMPLLALPEHQEREQQQDDVDDDEGNQSSSSSASENQRQRSRFKQSCFKSHSCFSLTHLHQQ